MFQRSAIYLAFVLLALPAHADQCFERTYSDAHLAANKNQTVQMIRAWLPDARSAQARVDVIFRKTHAEVVAEEAAAASAVEKGEPPPQAKTPRLYRADLHCWAPAPGAPEGAWQCGVECDGGTFTAWPRGEALLMRTRGGFLVSGECGEPGDNEAPRYVTDTNAIETTYKLFPIDPAKCE